jgi:hypothetical protein
MAKTPSLNASIREVGISPTLKSVWDDLCGIILYCEIDEICLEALKRQSKKFRYLLNEDAMATEKTAEGIRKFAADIAKLEKFIASKIN